MAVDPKVTVHFPSMDIVNAIKLLSKLDGNKTPSVYCKEIIVATLKDRGLMDDQGCLNHELLSRIAEEEQIKLHKLF